MTYDPLRLIQFCLEERIPIQIVDFGKAVAGVSLPQELIVDVDAPSVGHLNLPTKAILRVEAPIAVGKDLQQPTDQRDCYILFCVPRQALERMESPITTPPLIVRPS